MKKITITIPPRKPTWQIWLYERSQGWFCVWSTHNEYDLRQGILYAMGKVLEGSDADAFKLVRSDQWIRDRLPGGKLPKGFTII